MTAMPRQLVERLAAFNDSQCQHYLRHGIRLDDGATVLDIGANIGLFSLFVASRCRNPTIFAFEPSPDRYRLLHANCAAYGANVWAVNAGVPGRPHIHDCAMTSVSGIIATYGIEHIDLLKIDVGGNELAVLAGIDSPDWARIDQIIVEIRATSCAPARRIEWGLARKGYRCVIELKRPVENTGLVNLYASRAAP